MKREFIIMFLIVGIFLLPGWIINEILHLIKWYMRVSDRGYEALYNNLKKDNFLNQN